VIGVQVALGLMFSPVNAGAATFFVYAASFAARFEQRRDASRLILLITLVGVATAWGLSAPPYLWIFVAVFTPLVGAVNWHSMQVARTDAKLRRANAEIERLATVAERERIARDLHDVLGHTLTLIVLKSELASRLADRDPKRAAQEIREVEQVSRQALGDVRDAIAGYRATWEEELARARTMLDTAGIRGEFFGSPAPVERATEETLALAMREAITNVVRHARATVCRVRVERRDDVCRLEVADNGRGGALTQGNGLRGLRERVEALGGSVAWHGIKGTQLAVTLPATHS
jgi:two-component system, NarL family, sensor histidine kinase DesK